MTAATPHPPGTEPAELAEPGPGRVFATERTVRLSDVDPSGVVRLDAIARYLQDVATDDVRDAGVEDAVAWVVRRTTIIAGPRPRYGEEMELATWCSGTGRALAERRTSIRGRRGGRVETVSLWVSLDPASLRPAPLDGPHFDPYREAAGDRRVRARLLVPGPPSEVAERRPWPLRSSDIDLYSHVNNVVAWSAAEEAARRLSGGEPFGWGQVEYRRPIGPEETPVVACAPLEGAVGVWMLGPDGTPSVCARLGR